MTCLSWFSSSVFGFNPWETICPGQTFSSSSWIIINRDRRDLWFRRVFLRGLGMQMAWNRRGQVSVSSLQDIFGWNVSDTSILSKVRADWKRRLVSDFFSKWEGALHVPLLGSFRLLVLFGIHSIQNVRKRCHQLAQHSKGRGAPCFLFGSWGAF